MTTDSATDNLYLALVQCFVIILCGYVAGRSGIITKSEAKGLNTFVGTFSLPSLIFISLAQLDLALVNWKFLLGVTVAKAIVFFAVLGITLLISRPINLGRAALFAIFATQSNDFAIGYPMIDALYSQIHPEYSAYLYLMAPISLAILNPVGFVLLEINKRSSDERTCGWSLFGSTAKGIALNPVLLMTVLGISGNLIFSHKIPAILEAMLKVFGDAFSASALFLLGLMMVGQVHTLKGRALVIPGILISVKLLALPLVIRESISLLEAGVNATDTRDLSTFGFLYGTLPSAPALFVFTLRYNLDIDLIASAMVACTFLSAPLMFISAKMIDALTENSTADYTRELSDFALDASVASLIACCWLLICFFIFGGKKYKRVTHRITVCLVVAQLITAIGVIIWAQMGSTTTKSALWYVQFLMITGGVYAGRIWTAVLAVTLLFLSSRSLTFVLQLQKWIIPIGWGASILLVSLMAALISPSGSMDFDKGSPNFQLGRIEAAISVFLLVFCFVVTLGCLVLQQRYQRRTLPVVYSSLSSPLASPDGVNSQRNVADVEDLMSHATDISRHPCEFENGCPNGVGCSTNRESGRLMEESGDEELEDVVPIEQPGNPQTLRHLVLLILLLCSMLVGLALSIGTLVMESLSGIYAELAFLDIALNFGQSLIAFAIFGLDPGWTTLGMWLKKLYMMLPRSEAIHLPDEDALTPEVRAVRDQFARCHLVECRSRIAACRRRLLRVYRGVFTGTDLVDYLLEARLVPDRAEAVRYGESLLEARVLCHIDGTEHFHDRNLLYSFCN